MTISRPPKAADATRDALVRTGLDLFGRNGFDATSTREIAQVAGVNSAGIAYHFGGKDGLRQACAAVVVARMRQVLEQGGAGPDPQSAPAALDALLALIDRAVAFMARNPESEVVARFVLREMLAPTPAFELLYSGLFEPAHRRICGIWAVATGRPADDEATRLAVFATLGQVIYFRIGRPVVLRRMAWPDVGEAEAAAIAAAIKRSVRAAVAAASGDHP